MYPQTTEVTTYKLLAFKNFRINFEAAKIPTDEGNIVFDGDRHTITYVDSDDVETTNLKSNGIFKTMMELVMIQPLRI